MGEGRLESAAAAAAHALPGKDPGVSENGSWKAAGQTRADWALPQKVDRQLRRFVVIGFELVGGEAGRTWIDLSDYLRAIDLQRELVCSIQAVSEKEGHRGIRFQDLRHSSISLLLEVGIPVNTVQRRAFEGQHHHGHVWAFDGSVVG